MAMLKAIGVVLVHKNTQHIQHIKCLLSSTGHDSALNSLSLSRNTYSLSHTAPMKDPALTIQVRQDMKKPSSFEDDIGDGIAGGISR